MVKNLLSPLKVGDVVWLNLDPTKGQEKNKTRPGVVIQGKVTPLELITVLPVTHDNSKRNSLFFVKIMDLKKAGLFKPSVVDCYQIRTIAIERVIKKIGIVEPETIDKIKRVLALVLGIHSTHIAQDLDWRN